MGNQALTPTTTTTISVLSLLNISQPLTNVVLRVVTTDNNGKILAPQPPTITFKEISQEGFSFINNPLVFNLIKHPDAKNYRVSLESKGTFSNSILGQAFFSCKTFEHDKNTIFDVDFLTTAEQKIGTIQLQIFIPGSIFERNLLLQFSLENDTSIKQIHFKHGQQVTVAGGAGDQLSNFYGLLTRVLEFSEDYKSDLDILDITTSPSIIQPLVIVTLKFKDFFIKEAHNKYNKIMNEQGYLVLPCFDRATLNDVESLDTQYDLKAKLFYNTCDFDLNKIEGYLKNSEIIHSKNIQASIEWIQKNNYNIISKNFEWTADGNKSICIIWYHDDEQQNLKKYSLLEEEEKKQSFKKIELYSSNDEDDQVKNTFDQNHFVLEDEEENKKIEKDSESLIEQNEKKNESFDEVQIE
eukprot:gene2162-2027_t